MSDSLISKINGFHSYKYEPMTRRIINLNGALNANIDEFLEIAHLLDTNFIKYKFTTNIDIRILGKK